MERKVIKMVVSSTPILVVPVIPHDGGVRFLHRNDKIDIEPSMSDTVWKILGFCNGYNDISSIAELSKYPVDIVLKIISELEEMELVVDSKYQFIHFHRLSNYPSTINSNLTQDEIEKYTQSERSSTKPGEIFEFCHDKKSILSTIIENRRSCRSFSKRKLTIDQIGNTCRYAYSIPNHSVPSGGALYPIRIYVLIEEPQDGLNPGYYEYDSLQDHLVLFDDEVDIEQLKYCFNQEEMPFGSSVQIIIAADLLRQPYKYANRGYRLTLIEAGHVAENINLYCTDQGIGTCEMGGVQDKPLKMELNLEGEIWPLLAISIGYPADSETKSFDKIRFVEKNVGKNYPVKTVCARIFENDGSFFGAATTYLDGEGLEQYAGATSPSYADAIFKATIEGYERWCSSQVRVDFHGSANQMAGRSWLNPSSFFPLTQNQAKKCGVKSFSKDLIINWTKGVSYDGSIVYIPSDLVYYGQKDNENRIYYGHSSGIAAHFDFEEAKKRAVVELIERDALMRNWFEQKPPHILDDVVLPIHVRKRISHWAKQDRRLVVLQIPSSFGMVFETAIVSDEFPCFVSGAAATIDKDSIENTILKSLQEAEYNLLLSLLCPDTTHISPQKVLTPVDHGKVYHFRENVEKLRWLYEDGPTVNHIETEIQIGHPETFFNEQLKLVTVDISNKASDLKVVRVFSPCLVPINFGFNAAHYTHPAIKHRGVNPKSMEMPHYFA